MSSQAGPLRGHAVNDEALEELTASFERPWRKGKATKKIQDIVAPRRIEDLYFPSLIPLELGHFVAV